MPRRGQVGDRLCLVLMLALVMLAPLFRSGKPPLAMALLGVLAIVGLAWVLLRGRAWGVGRGMAGLLFGLLLLPLLQWLPVPGLGRDLLPGQSDYYTAVALAGANDGAVSLSVVPRDTLLGGLLLLLPLGVFVMAQALSHRQLRLVVRFVFGMAIVQAVIGLMQFGGGPQSPLYLGMEYSHFGSAVGTYTSRNNYVGFMYLVLMLSLAMFITTLGRRNRAFPGRKPGLRARLAYWATSDGHLAFFFGALSLLLLLAVVFSRSRAGIGMAMIGIVLITVLLSRRIGGGNVFGLVGRVTAIGLALAIAIGLGPVLDRFSAHDPIADGRWTIFAGVLDGIRQFFPLGSGTGSFVNTFPAFQDVSQAMFLVNRAHNSYLEWMFTGGVFAMVLIAGFLVVYARRWGTVWKRGDWGEFRYLQVGAGLGLLLMGLHELVDYNLFVPANMVYFALFAGLFFHDYEEPVRRRREPRYPVQEPLPAPREPAPRAGWGDEPELIGPAGDERREARPEGWNPFMAGDDDAGPTDPDAPDDDSPRKKGKTPWD